MKIVGRNSRILPMDLQLKTFCKICYLTFFFTVLFWPHLIAAAQLPSESQKDSRQIVFIDSGILSQQSLLNPLPSDFLIYYLDEKQNSLEQISGILSGRTGLEAIHIFSHGGPGYIRFGNTQVNKESISDHLVSFSTIRSSLIAGGDILLYGCNIAEGKKGQELLNSLAKITNADIAASANATGNPVLGGDSFLEWETGTIETKSLKLKDTYGYLLGPPSDLTTFNGLIGTFDFLTYLNPNSTSVTDLLGTGWDVYVTGVGGGQNTTIYLNDDDGDQWVSLDDDSIAGQDYGANLQLLRLVSNDGSEFPLQSIQVKPQAPTNITVTGYKDGSLVPGASKTFTSVPANWTTLSFTDNVNFSSAGAIDDFRLTFSAAFNNCYIDDIDITTVSAPSATTGAATSISSVGATLNGTVNANNGSTTVTFEYGLTTGYGTTVTADQSPVTGSSNTAVSKALSGLTANTTYHYRVVGTNGTGTTNGSDQTLTTSGATPVATTNAASSESSSGATLNGTVNANNESTTVTFEYGLTTGYGTTVTADQSPVTGSSNTAVSKALSGLTANTTYHYRVVGINGTGTTNGSDQTFTTSGTAPVATTNAASAISSTDATLNGTVNANNGSTTVTFEYGLTIGYGTTVTADQSPVTGSSNTAVSRALSGLTANTTYHYRVVGINGTGTTNGSDQTFTISGAAPVATTNAANAISSTGATLNGTVNANNGSTTVTFEYGLTIGYGTTVTADQSPVTGSSNTAVSKALSGLTANTTYHYRVVGINATGTTNGSDGTFTTSAPTVVLPTLTTNVVTLIQSTVAVCGGNVTDNGGESISERGICWSTSPDPTTNDDCKVENVTDSGVGSFSTTISQLSSSTKYYVRAFAVNSAGTAYGLTKELKTKMYFYLWVIPTIHQETSAQK
jgi:phosphodiesterase/alkaline phosphatase D-like protein